MSHNFNLTQDKLFLGIKIQLSFFKSSNKRPSIGVFVVTFSFLKFSTFIVFKLEIHT